MKTSAERGRRASREQARARGVAISRAIAGDAVRKLAGGTVRKLAGSTVRVLAGSATAMALALAAAPPPAAMATTGPEMRGEWQMSVSNSKGTAKGIAIISQEANGSGEFASSSASVEGVVPASFSGTLHSSEEASVKVVAQPYGPLPESEFTSSTIAVHSSGGSVSMSGSGTIFVKSTSSSESATFAATRVRTYKELEEQKEREEHEREEREARENVRGEWTLKLESGGEKVEGIARITASANTSNEFASRQALFGGSVPGSFTGTLEGSKAKVTIDSQASGPLPQAEFTSKTIAVSTSTNPTSMTGSGTLTLNSTMTMPATLTATRIRNYKELKALEGQEKLEREAAEKKAREAKEAQEATEKAQREARESQELQAREAQEREALEKLEAQGKATEKASGSTTGPTAPATPLSKTLAVTSSGSLSIVLSNPNAWSVKGSIVLTAAAGHAGKAQAASMGARTSTKTSAKGKKPTPPLASSSFTIGPHGHASVKLTLSKAARAELARAKTLVVTATVLTQANAGGTRVSKAFKLTLRVSTSHSHHR
jgi:hypothetical protein